MLRALPGRVLRKAEYMLKTSRLYNASAESEKRREARVIATVTVDSTAHLREALDWLKRAQDATADRGVSRGFGVAWVPYLKCKGWQPSYPETTGYIIPTFFDCASLLGDEDLRRRAIEMADWELDVQMPGGAVMGGTADRPPTPAVFNTGQVMLGWIRAFLETNRESYLRGLERAADFLLSMQDDDGTWRRGNSQYASAVATTYNSRVGWALSWTGALLERDSYVEAGKRNLDRTLVLQKPNGWFVDNDLEDPSAPLTHTIAYAMEGLLGGFDILGDRRYLDAVGLAADHIIACVDDNGQLSGRIGPSWNAMASWSCLTGSAQIAALLFRLHRLTDNERFRATATKLLRSVKLTQNCVSNNPGLRGGIKGSYPFDGGYRRYELLNWATKFFIDALLLEMASTRFSPVPAWPAAAASRGSPVSTS
jgi:hypothetical protein